MKRGRLLLGIFLCYAASYGVLVLLAARKGRDIADPFSLAVWLFGAVLILLFCAIVPLAAWTIARLRGMDFRAFFPMWGATIVVCGLALICNAR